jgi:hypothetical protein
MWFDRTRSDSALHGICGSAWLGPNVVAISRGGIQSRHHASAFLRVHRPDLLSDLFGPIVIPGAVATELDVGAALVGSWRSAMPFVEARVVEPSPLLELLRAELDPGEAEAIALAAEGKAKLLIIDEIKGTTLARRLALRVVGSVGVCALAKERGLIAAARPRAPNRVPPPLVAMMRARPAGKSLGCAASASTQFENSWTWGRVTRVDPRRDRPLAWLPWVARSGCSG